MGIFKKNDIWQCIKIKCDYTDPGNEGDKCPKCGKNFYKVDGKESARINAKKIKFKSDPNYLRKESSEKELNRLNQQKELEIKREEKKQEAISKLLFHETIPDVMIQNKIIEDMANLYGHEAGTKWMRIGTLLSFNSTEQMIGAGFKAIIDQNKILIRQNELLYRQNKLMTEQLEKLNKQFEDTEEE